MGTALPEKVMKLFKAFKGATEEERKAQAMYKEAMKLTDDEQLKQVFESFYQDELRHEQELIERYNDLRHEFNLAEEE